MTGTPPSSNNILILGGAGFLGANLVRRCLVEPGTRVTVVDSLDPLFRSSTDSLNDVMARISFVRGDIRDGALMSKMVRDQDVIFNCAAQSSHPLSIRDPFLDIDINCRGTLSVLESVRTDNPGARVIYVSSSTVIGRADERAVDERHREEPLEMYSANKLVAEKYHRVYHSLHGLNTLVLRFANLYGPYGKPYPEFGFLNYFIHQAWADRTIQIFGKGDQTRNVMYIEDAADILWFAARIPALAGKTFFATGDEHLSLNEIAERIVSVFDRGRVAHVDWPEDRRRMEIGSVTFSSARIRESTGWNPRHTLATGLQLTKWMLETTGPSRTKDQTSQ